MTNEELQVIEEVATLLAPFRRQTERAGTLTIRSLRERKAG